MNYVKMSRKLCRVASGGDPSEGLEEGGGPEPLLGDVTGDPVESRESGG